LVQVRVRAELTNAVKEVEIVTDERMPTSLLAGADLAVWVRLVTEDRRPLAGVDLSSALTLRVAAPVSTSLEEGGEGEDEILNQTPQEMALRPRVTQDEARGGKGEGGEGEGCTPHLTQVVVFTSTFAVSTCTMPQTLNVYSVFCVFWGSYLLFSCASFASLILLAVRLRRAFVTTRSRQTLLTLNPNSLGPTS
jgi:hypothetical protein